VPGSSAHVGVVGNPGKRHLESMRVKRAFAASITREDGWYIGQCLEVDVASQGESEEEALANLREALDLYFELPIAGPRPTWAD